GGETNTCWNAVDRHVDNGRGAQRALIWDSPITGKQKTYTYLELKDAVAIFAGVLCNHGVEKGDRVLIYMPAVPEAVIGMLACARIGAIHSVVFGGFAAAEVAKRLDDATPKVLLTASCGIEPGRIIPYLPILNDAFAIAGHVPSAVISLAREEQAGELKPGRDHDWREEVARANPVDWVPVAATDPLYILYTSGTTGKPKGVVRDNGGHAVAMNWSMKGVYDMDPGDCWWAASDIGWVVGHSYIVYAPLIHGNTTIMFEGKPVGTPDAGVFWRVIAEHGVKALFTAPTAFRAIKKEDPRGEFIGKHDLSRFVTLFLAGERADPDTIQWAEKMLDRPVIDHWWQTETGWAMAANCLGLGRFPVKYGSPTKPTPGYDIDILGDDGQPVPDGEIGAICVKLPLPPSGLPTLWNNDEGYIESYMADYPGYYKTGDAGMYDEDGYIYIMSRTDDLINTAGHRLSTGAMEEVLSKHQDVAECAVIGVADQLKGQVPVGFMVLKAGVNREHQEIVKEVVAMVRNDIGAVASFRQATVIDRLPKTRSGKILRKTMRQIADSEDFATPPTIDDPAILDEIREALKPLGYAGG
ncbi:MAG: AMP-binding protein, partial [Alphaproteobacteria bacterium]|nr:AMP-binding protein [Alphaproteobacteria bacterium]